MTEKLTRRGETLPELREEVGLVDEELCALFAQRFELARRIGKKKRQSGLPVTDSERERVVRENWQRMAKQMGVNLEFAERLVSLLMDEAKRVQNREGDN